MPQEPQRPNADFHRMGDRQPLPGHCEDSLPRGDPQGRLHQRRSRRRRAFARQDGSQQEASDLGHGRPAMPRFLPDPRYFSTRPTREGRPEVRPVLRFPTGLRSTMQEATAVPGRERPSPGPGRRRLLLGQAQSDCYGGRRSRLPRGSPTQALVVQDRLGKDGLAAVQGTGVPRPTRNPGPRHSATRPSGRDHIWITASVLHNPRSRRQRTPAATRRLVPHEPTGSGALEG